MDNWTMMKSAYREVGLQHEDPADRFVARASSLWTAPHPCFALHTCVAHATNDRTMVMSTALGKSKDQHGRHDGSASHSTQSWQQVVDGKEQQHEREGIVGCVDQPLYQTS